MREYSLKDWTDKPIPEVIEEMEAQGFTVYQGSPNHLLLDLDNADAIYRYDELLPMARRLFNVRQVDSWISKSGQGNHVILWSPEPIDPVVRIAIQACLGSDPRRELLGLMRLRNGEEEPSLLFRPGGKRGRKN